MALTLTEYLARPMPETKWVVSQLLPVGGALYLHGMPKMGKSLLMLGLAQAIAGDEPYFQDFPVNVHGKVLYIQVDMPPTLWHSYITKVLKSGKTMDKLHLIDRLEIPNHSLNLLHPKDALWLKGQVDMVQPDVVIFDTLRSLHSGDENDNTVMSNVYEKLLSIVGSHRSMVIMHHSRKPGLLQDLINDARGATSVSGKVDVIAQLIRSGKKNHKLLYTTRDENLHPDGLTMLQDRSTGLFGPIQSPSVIFAQMQLTNPAATVKDLMDGLLERGVSKSHAHRLISGKSVEDED